MKNKITFNTKNILFPEGAYVFKQVQITDLIFVPSVSISPPIVWVSITTWVIFPFFRTSTAHFFIGSITIANHLNSLGIPSPSGNEWVPRTIVSILKNEKYIGNMLLQKFYTKDHLTKKDAVNKGELPQYYVEGSHDGIISKEVFDEVKAKFDAKPSFPNMVTVYEDERLVFEFKNGAEIEEQL